MTKRDPKDKLDIPTRTARPKAGMFDNLRKPEQVESISLEELTAPSEGVPTSHHDSPPVTTTPRPKQKTAAPEKDFNRRANSLERDAMPAGLFPGSTFKIYNAVYLRTLGAVVPRRTVRASRRDFIDWTDIRNLKTVDSHLRYLMAKGLLVRKWELGSTEGSEYEIVLPEELPRLTTSPHQSPPVTPMQNTGSGYPQSSGSGGEGQSVDFQRTSSDDKTELRLEDKKLDDEAAPVRTAFFEIFEQLTKDLTGKGIAPAESSKYRELFEVIATEARIAAGRTTVSSVPAFLAEHLRRRLWKKDKRQIDEEGQMDTPKSAARVDASNCPDCHGTTLRYKDGDYSKGIEKCPHDKLSKTGEEKP